MAATERELCSFFGIFILILFVSSIVSAERNGNQNVYSIVDGHQGDLFSEIHFRQHNRVERAATDNLANGTSSTSNPGDNTDPTAPSANANSTSSSRAEATNSLDNIATDAVVRNGPNNTASEQQTTSTSITTNNPTTTAMKDPFADADIYHDYHTYYNSTAMKETVATHYVDLSSGSRHEVLSSSHRVAAVIKLKFKFPFYGHPITNITVATGGFLYMSPFLHQWLTATQYIAPLMANFDPSLSKSSHIYYLNEDEKFTVEWREVILRDQPNYGNFTFQASLHMNGSISFGYKNVPIDVNKISDDNHPVKIGLSDAYYNDTYLPNWGIRRRTIFEYHQVALRKSLAKTGAVILVNPLPTCNVLEDCDSCTRHTGVNFDCMWCNTIGRCSDGLDWFRQHWDKYGCKAVRTNQTKDCAQLAPPKTPIIHPISPLDTKKKCSGGKCGKSASVPVAVIVVLILVLLGLVAGVGGWTFYAYTHPTSRSGMWLMEHRPSQIKAKIKFWKSSGNSDSAAKYRTETDA